MSTPSPRPQTPTPGAVQAPARPLARPHPSSGTAAAPGETAGRFRPTPAPGHAPDPLSGLARVVEAILRHAAVEEQRESAARGGQSPLAWVLWCMELGATIRTTGREEPARALHRDEPLPALGLSRPVADAVATDGQGLATVTRAFGRRTVELAFEHRIGWAMATDVQRGKWAAKLASGDSRPALDGMHEGGVAALGLLLAEWNEAVTIARAA